MYGVALQIEDYATLLDTEPLSSVGLQFLLNVFKSDKACASQPTFSTFTRGDKSCIGIPVNKIYMERFYATSYSNDPT